MKKMAYYVGLMMLGSAFTFVVFYFCGLLDAPEQETVVIKIDLTSLDRYFKEQQSRMKAEIMYVDDALERYYRATGAPRMTTPPKGNLQDRVEAAYQEFMKTGETP